MSQLYTRIKPQGQHNAPGLFSYRCLVFRQAVLFILAVVLMIPPAVHAQLDSGLQIQAPDLSDFPIHSVQVKLPYQPDPQSTDLKVDQFQIFEDEVPVSIFSVNQARPGVHFTLAVNGGYAFDVRDQNGESPFSKLVDALLNWSATRTFAEADSWSFVTNEDVKIRNTAARQAWSNALQGYQPNFRMMEPQLTSLEQAIALARERVVSFGVDKALLYITLPPSVEQINPIRSLTELASSAGIHVFVWMIGDPYFLTNDQGGAIMDLAEKTGGAFFHYTSENDIPNPEVYLAPLGKVHILTYESLIRESGSYTLRVQASLPDGQFSSERVPFDISISPPHPIFVSPPTTITLQTSATTETPDVEFVPESAELEIMIEFPDGYPRQIAASRLFVDGQVVDENTTAAVERLTWDLTSYRNSGEHKLQVEVEDSLGLSGFTIETPIEISVVYPESEPEIPESQTGIIILGGVILAAAALLIVWWIPRFWKLQRIKRFRENLQLEMEARGKRNVINIDVENRSYATLLPLKTALDGQGAIPIPNSQASVVIGSKPGSVDLVLEENDVDGKQAQLYLRDGNFWLKDLNSSGGTWVNYELIGQKPIQLKPGDLLHFGKSGFRFTIVDDNATPVVAVTKYEPLL